MKLLPAVFFDRDGTLIDAIHRPDFEKKYTAAFNEKELKFKPDAKAVMEKLRHAGWLRIIITNQPDVAHGYLSQMEWQSIHDRVLDELRPDDIMLCRHKHEDNCPFKKPKPGMILAMADKWGVDLSRSFMVGDTDADTIAGKTAGCKTILIDAPYNRDMSCDYRVPDLTAVANIILA